RRNSVRYHHGQANGLSTGIGRFEKLRPMGKAMPGRERMFIPTSGSGRGFSATRAPTTVAGTWVACQPDDEKPAVEISAPVAFASHDDWRDQPSRRDRLASSSPRTWADLPRAKAPATAKRRYSGRIIAPLS